MGHDHHHHNHSGNRHIATAFFLNLGFTIIEFVGGFLTNSVAIQSDALHDAGDTASLGLAWYFQRLSKQGGNSKYTFGYHRFNTLGAIITGVILVAGSLYILSEAIPRIFSPEKTNVEGMIGLAVLGVIVNGLAVLRMRQGGKSLNEEMISWHLLEDVLGWVVVLIGSVVMYFFNLPWIDPLLSIFIAIFILRGVLKNLWKASQIILQASPANIDIQEVKKILEEIDGVDHAHHLHLWTLDGEINLFSAHIETDGNQKLVDLKKIKKAIYKSLEEHFHIDHVTLEFETKGECGEDSTFCK